MKHGLQGLAMVPPPRAVQLAVSHASAGAVPQRPVPEPPRPARITTPYGQGDVRFFAAPPDMEGCFATFCRINLTLDDGQILSDQLQPEWANVRFFTTSPLNVRYPGNAPLPPTHFVATGPSTQSLRFELGTTRMWGIGLFPLGWARFSGRSAAEVANTVADGPEHPAFAGFAPLADGLFAGPPDDEAEFAHLIAGFRRLARPVRDEAAIRAVHAALLDTHMATVAELAECAGLSTRTLERLCRRHFGFPPKMLLRRQRMMRTLVAYLLDPGKNWSAVVDGLYHDQAHFVHEFHAFMEMSPSEYGALDLPIMRAFMAARLQMLGSPVQTLSVP